MRFAGTDGIVVQIDNRAVGGMWKHRQRYVWSREAGGILLGCLGLDERAILIGDITKPGRQDVRGRQFFKRGRHRAQICVDSAWRKSKGIVNYLGEWHTHPEDDPFPSSADLANWRRIACEVRCDQDDLITIIVGRKQMRAWMVKKGSGVVKELTRVRT